MQKLLFSFLLFFLAACGQTSNDKIQSNIQNTKTSKHVNIPGTRLYIIPPPNFSIAKTFIGLQKGETSMLNIYDLVGGNFYTNAATFSKTAFEQQGAKVFDYQEIKVNGYQGKYIFMQSNPTTEAYALVFGDTTFSTMIMAASPVTDAATEKQIIAAMNTIYYDKSKKIDPFETAFFSLDDKNSKFKFLQYNANLYIYTVDGVDNTKEADNPFVLVTQLPMDNSMTTKSIADMMVGKAQQYGLTNSEVKNISQERINGYDTYEAEVYGQMKGKSSVIYQCVVAKGDRSVTIQGIAKKDMQTSVQDFKNLAHTIQIK